MVIRWAPFVNRRLSLVKEPSGVAKWFLRFVKSLRIGWSATPSSPHRLGDVLRTCGLRLNGTALADARTYEDRLRYRLHGLWGRLDAGLLCGHQVEATLKASRGADQ